MRIEDIHESLVNGQRRQMVSQIDRYEEYNFWQHYKEYLENLYVDKSSAYDYFTDACISYHRITNR